MSVRVVLFFFVSLKRVVSTMFWLTTPLSNKRRAQETAAQTLPHRGVDRFGDWGRTAEAEPAICSRQKRPERWAGAAIYMEKLAVTGPARRPPMSFSLVNRRPRLLCLYTSATRPGCGRGATVGAQENADLVYYSIPWELRSMVNASMERWQDFVKWRSWVMQPKRQSSGERTSIIDF
jgi:hypothetical protein